MAKGKPGRPKLSEEDKAKRKDAAAAKKVNDAVSAAMQRFPAEQADRLNLFTTGKELADDLRIAQNNLGEHKKRMKDKYGFLPEAEKIADILLKTKIGGHREAVLRQVGIILSDRGFETQPDLFMKMQPGSAPLPEDDKPVMDATPAGKRSGRTKAPKTAAEVVKDAVGSQEPTPGIPLDEAEANFKAASAAAAEAANKAAREKHGEAAHEMQLVSLEADPATPTDKVVPISGRKRGGPPAAPKVEGTFAQEQRAANEDTDTEIKARSAALADAKRRAGGPPPAPKGLGTGAVH